MDRITANPNLLLLNVGFAELDGNWNWKDVRSPFARIYYVTHGHAMLRMNGQVHKLNPGNIYLVPPFTLHDNECDSLFSLYYIHFYEEAAAREPLFYKYDFPVSVPGTKTYRMLTERLLTINPERHLRYIDPRIYDNEPGFARYVADNKKLAPHTIMETRGILDILLAGFVERALTVNKTRDGRVAKALEYIHANLDRELTVAELSSMSCLTADHFTRLFRSATGHTPLVYINMKKIEKAQLLLLTTGVNVKEIASSLSIDNIPYFNRLFRRFTGKTPGQYRNEAAK